MSEHAAGGCTRRCCKGQLRSFRVLLEIRACSLTMPVDHCVVLVLTRPRSCTHPKQFRPKKIYSCQPASLQVCRLYYLLVFATERAAARQTQRAKDTARRLRAFPSSLGSLHEQTGLQCVPEVRSTPCTAAVRSGPPSLCLSVRRRLGRRASCRTRESLSRWGLPREPAGVVPAAQSGGVISCSSVLGQRRRRVREHSSRSFFRCPLGYTASSTAFSAARIVVKFLCRTCVMGTLSERGTVDLTDLTYLDLENRSDAHPGRVVHAIRCVPVRS